MRSQATKPLPKKGALSKTTLKASSASKQAKKKAVSPKKVKNLVNKSLVKSPKKNSPKDEAKSDEESSANDKYDMSTESPKGGPSKASTCRSESPAKKSKKEPREKKDAIKNAAERNVKKIVPKKIIKSAKKANVIAKSITTDSDSDSDNVKYKINLNAVKKTARKFSKAKTIIRKGNVNQKKKCAIQKKQETPEKEEAVDFKNKTYELKENNDVPKVTEIKEDVAKGDIPDDKNEDPKPEEISVTEISTTASNNPACDSVTNLGETQKVEIERPPKFFTSSRPPRTVDIDVKCCKNAKGNLSVSERFLSMKCETKNDDINNDKNASNALISQGPEIDVYTFTEKVDSPKSILSDFRSPITKNVGRVRPIARVKGTVVDRKTETEKKKYSPHRPIEEVVKQLKASKRSEELNTNQYQDITDTSSLTSSVTNSEKEIEDKPKPLVSKSYKMVARKSSITGKPFSPIKFFDQEPTGSKSEKATASSVTAKKKPKKQQKKTSLSDDELESCKFALNTKDFHYTSSDESVNESNDDNDTKESSESDTSKNKKSKNKKYKRITDSAKKTTSKELKELSKDSLIDLKEDSIMLGNEKPSKRRLKLLSMWSGPKKHRMASLNAIAKVHCLYENESRTHMELGLMRTVDRHATPSTSKSSAPKKKETKPKASEKMESTSESEYDNGKDKKDESSESSDDTPPQRTLRGVPGIRSAGKYWDPKSSTSSSEDSEQDSKKKTVSPEKNKKTTKASSPKSDSDKPLAKMKKTAGVPVKKKRNRNEVVMDLKDMVVQKRMASLNATAILAASYEKRSPKSNRDETTSDSCSDESFSQKSKNGVSSGLKSEVKSEDTKKDSDETVLTDRKQKMEVIVNQDTDVTITGVYSTHLHEGFCTVSGMQYRISSTSHTKTTATANCEKEGCSGEDGSRYTPLTALSSMQPPAEHSHSHPHPVGELGGLGRRAGGCSSAFSAPSPAAHHDPGYYQPAGPLIKETGADAERALARYHPPPHYHAPHPPVLQQYGPPYYPADLCYGRYYRPPGPYHMPPQPDAQMVGVGSEPYPPPQYYGSPPCYQHSPQRIPYVEYRGCPCPLNACPKNVHIGPVTGKAPTGGGPLDVNSALAPPGAAFRPKVRACALDAGADAHGSGKDPPLEQEPSAAAGAPHPCPLPAIGGASPKRELFDVRDNMRVIGDTPGPSDAIGPPSPARGSAGVCAPQPPPIAPRRARLGKAMARRSLAGDDTALLLSAPQPLLSHSDADDDVMAISPPMCAPIDLSSSDERSTPLVDVKKENEGPTYTSRKTDAQALREHNTTALSDPVDHTDSAKAVKRKYSRPKLEIDMIDIQLEDSCKTNGIGEHVKLQKRRKVSCEQTSVRTETVTKEPKKKAAQRTGRTPKTPTSEKKTAKRKLDNSSNSPRAKKMLIESSAEEDPRLKNVAALPEDPSVMKPKNKSALLLDNLLRKNSVDRADGKGINPAELFLSPSENTSQTCSKKTLNINNNIVENNAPISGVRPNTIAAVTQLIEKKLAYKNACKLEKVDSKVTHSLKSVLKTPNDKLKCEETKQPSVKCKSINEKNCGSIVTSDANLVEVGRDKCESLTDKRNHVSINNKNISAAEEAINPLSVSTTASLNRNETNVKLSDESHSLPDKMTDQPANEGKDPLNNTTEVITLDLNKSDKMKRPKLGVSKVNGQMRHKSIEKVAKLLVSKKPAAKTDDSVLATESVNLLKENVDEMSENEKSEKAQTKRCKLGIHITNDETKGKSIEKVAKLLVSKKPTPKTDDTSAIENETKQSIYPILDEIMEQATSEKALAKRCKLSNGEMKAKNVEKVVKLLVSKKPAIKTDEATLVVEDACASPIPTMGRRPRRRRSGPMRRMRRAPVALAPPAMELRAPPRWSNGWNWDGENYISRVYLNNDARLDRTARCWARMTHASGDSVARGDCVLLRASTARAQPFVARVASLWENPDDGEMMVSLVWYYRPEHTERGREPADAPDEVFASRHRDANSVACIEDKCHVLTFNEYCRYRKRLKAVEEGITIAPTIVPPLPASEITPLVAPNDSKLPPSVSPELVMFCRKVYDFRSKKIQMPNK